MTIVNCAEAQHPAAILRQCLNWLSDVPRHEIDTLVQACNWRSFNKGQILFYEGDVLTHSLLIISGCLEVFRYTAEGNEKRFDLIPPGKILALAATFMQHGRYPMNVRALEEGRALQIPKKHIFALCRRYPEISFHLLEHFCGTLYAMVNRIDWLTSSTTAQRLAKYLLDLQEGQPDADVLVLPMNRQQLATWLGVRHETLTRMLSEWQKKGYLAVQGSQLQIRQGEVLQALAQPAQRSF